MTPAKEKSSILRKNEQMYNSTMYDNDIIQGVEYNESAEGVSNFISIGDVEFNRESDVYYTLLRRFLKDKNYRVNQSPTSMKLKKVKVFDFRDNLFQLINSLKTRSDIVKKYIPVKTKRFKSDILGMKMMIIRSINKGGIRSEMSSRTADFYNVSGRFSGTKTDFSKDFQKVTIAVPATIYDYFLKGRSSNIYKYFDSEDELNKFVLLVVYPLILYFYNKIYAIDLDMMERSGISPNSIDISDVGNLLGVLNDYIEQEIKGARKSIDVPDGDRFYKRALKIVRKK